MEDYNMGAFIPMNSFKVYLLNDDLQEAEIRRFELPYKSVNFQLLTQTCVQLFDKLASFPSFTLYWKDEENDMVAISSDEGLELALLEMSDMKVKKFYIKTKESSTAPMGFSCKECLKGVDGFIYKCLVCSGYNLCRSCEQLGIHPEHPMLRLSTNLLKSNLCPYILPEFDFLKFHMGKKHAHKWLKESKKKKRHGRKEGYKSDDSEEECPVKRINKKCKRLSHYYNLWGNEQNLQHENSGTSDMTQERPFHLKNLETVGKVISSFLQPFGVSFDIEHSSTSNEKAAEESTAKTTQKGSSSTCNIPSQQKKVNFVNSEQAGKEKNGISTEVSSNEKPNKSPESEDLASFEELKLDDLNNGSPSNGNVNNATQSTSKEQETANGSFYPNLNQSGNPNDPVIIALNKMISMGFNNDGNWLARLLEAKNGDINQVLEFLLPTKKS